MAGPRANPLREAEARSTHDDFDDFDELDPRDLLDRDLHEQHDTYDPRDPLDPDALDEAGGRSQVDELLDELVPPDLDWRRIVRRYPIPALVVAGAAGYWLGRSRRGTAIAEALAGALALGVTRELIDADLEEDLDPESFVSGV